MAGLGPSVVRAATVAVIYALGVLAGRRHHMLDALALAALLLVLHNPDELFFAGFQLSFVSVLGLVALAPALDRFLVPRLGLRRLDRLPGAHGWLRGRLNRFFTGTFAVTASAWLAAQPLVAYHFGVLNPVTPIVNLLLLPAFGVILLTAFAVLIVETLLGGFIVAHVSDALVTTLVTLSRLASRLPGAWMNLPPPPVAWLVAYYASLVLVAVAPLVRLRRRRAALVPLALLVGLIAWQLRPARPDEAQLVLLDVGQGSCALVRSPEGHAVLIDAGTQSAGDISKWTVIPYLVRHRVFTLDAIVVSHADVDHVSGLPRLVENFRVRKVLLSEDFHHSPAGLRVERWLLERGVAVETVGRGDRLALGSVTLEVLHPPKASAHIASWTRNERSAAVRGHAPGGRFLVFGDLSGRGFADLLACTPRSLEAEVAVAAHHGGVSGVERVAGRYRWAVVLFSAGEQFVRPEKRAIYASAGARTFSTAEAGTITVRFGEPIKVETYLPAGEPGGDGP
jgi:competence protein ComEC